MPTGTESMDQDLGDDDDVFKHNLLSYMKSNVNLFISFITVRHRTNRPFWDDNEVDRRLRVDFIERNTLHASSKSRTSVLSVIYTPCPEKKVPLYFCL